LSNVIAYVIAYGEVNNESIVASLRGEEERVVVDQLMISNEKIS
jgi:hypothetical protein